MSREEDVLFCKLAISSGLVKEADAHKVLSLCEKKHRETGRRPMIGVVFEKYNLLGKPEVQRVYQAIQKRTGAPAGAPRRASAERPRAGKTRGNRGGAGRREAQPQEDSPKGKVDQNTLILGVASIVVVLGVLAFMFFKLGEKPKRVAPVAKGTEVEAPATPGAVSPAPAVAAAAPAGVTAPAAAATSPASRPGVKEPVAVSRDQLHEISNLIADIRSTHGDNPAEGLTLLETQKKKIESSNALVPENLLNAIRDFEALKKDFEASGGQRNIDSTPGAQAKPEEPATSEPEPALDPEPEAEE